MFYQNKRLQTNVCFVIMIAINVNWNIKNKKKNIGRLPISIKPILITNVLVCFSLNWILSFRVYKSTKNIKQHAAA